MISSDWSVTYHKESKNTLLRHSTARLRYILAPNKAEEMLAQDDTSDNAGGVCITMSAYNQQGAKYLRCLDVCQNPSIYAQSSLDTSLP